MNRIPFTASQWQELEHQALIFKYIVSGIPVPSDLLFSLHRTTYAGTSLSSKFLSPQSQHAAWSCFQMGMVGKKIDPEPGRCRRTDGKKWRCAKEAYPDSKYCERHMHRGKNRSRKHVEVLNNTPSPNPSLKPTTLYSLNPAASASSTPQSDNSNPSSYNNFLDTQDFRRNRYTYGVKDGVDEHAFFCEPSGTMRSFSASSMENSWPLAANSSSSSRQREYSNLQLQSHGDGERQSHLFHGVPLVKNERGDHEPNKTTHRFFDEEPIRSSRDWDSSSTTRLSISIPSSSSNDYFPLFNSRRKLDG